MTKEDFQKFARDMLCDADAQLSYAKSSTNEELVDEVRQHDPQLADLMVANRDSIEKIVVHIDTRLG